MEADIVAAQARLETKRASLKQTGPEQIFSHDVVSSSITDIVCEVCGGFLTRINIFGDVKDICTFCAQKEIDEESSRMQAEAVEQRKLDENARMKRSLGLCLIGDRFIGKTFGDYIPANEKASRVAAYCKSYAEKFNAESGTNLLMIGSPGTGKNMLSAIIAQELFKNKQTSLHTTAMKLVRRIKATWKNNNEDEQEVIDSFVRPSLLVIDEIGVQFVSATEQLFLTEVINERYEKRRPTILISNLTLSQLTDVMGVRAIDRFYDDGSKILVFDWPSYRRRESVTMLKAA